MQAPELDKAGDKLTRKYNLSTWLEFLSELSQFRDVSRHHLRTGFQDCQVLEKKGENAPMHSLVRPLSTTTNLN